MKKIKKKRIDICSLSDFITSLVKVGYEITEENYKSEVIRIFNISEEVFERLDSCIKNNISYRANDIKGFIDYIEKIVLYEKEHKKLCENLKGINELVIKRIEYDRVMSSQEKVDHILKEIDEIKRDILDIVTTEEKIRLGEVEKEIEEEYLYAKDIELLKKMLNSNNMKEEYDEENSIKTYTIQVPDKINIFYSNYKEGTIEYYNFLKTTIPRLQRLIKNLHKYMYPNDRSNESYSINQSSALQDSINIAIAKFNNREFKAISGSNDVFDYCKSPYSEETKFISRKVNKLGQLGLGYNRVNDSEKKILETIHKEIQSNELEKYGELVLFSKWEPCPSCYYVMSQFSKEYPHIRIKVKYDKRYGEK